LEFVTFNIAPPNAKGECLTDFFLVTGGSTVPQVCGTNDGQHCEKFRNVSRTQIAFQCFSVLYSITSDSGPSTISMVMDTTVTSAATRQWNIRIYQFECSSRNLGESRNEWDII
jgi:hypothetical protein